MTGTHSEGRTRYYPTPTHEFSEKLETKTHRGAGLAPGNKTVYGVPTALLRKSIIKSRFTEVRSQQEASQTKRGLNDQSEFRTSTR